MTEVQNLFPNVLAWLAGSTGKAVERLNYSLDSNP